jgi:hypothetical protein
VKKAYTWITFFDNTLKVQLFLIMITKTYLKYNYRSLHIISSKPSILLIIDDFTKIKFHSVIDDKHN